MSTVAAFSSITAPIAAVTLLMGVYLPRHIAGHLGLGLAAVGAAFGLVRVLDLCVDPLIGLAMDRTRTSIGRFRPWLILGTPVMMLAVYMLFLAQPGISYAYLVTWLLVLYLGMSVLTLGQAAWAAALATNYNDRSRVYGVIHAVGVLGSVTILLLPFVFPTMFGGPDEGVGARGWLLIGALPLTVAICAFFVPERVAPKRGSEHVSWRDYWQLVTRPEVLRIIFADLMIALGPGTTAALYLFFFHDARGYTTPQTSLLLIFYIGAGLLGAIFWTRVAGKFGKHRTLMASTVVYAAAQTTLMLIPAKTMSLAIPGMASVGFMSAAFIPLIRAMVADVADEVRLETGKERAGLLYALVTSTQKVGSAVTVSISYAVLQAVGYNAAPGAVNTPAAIEGLELCYVFAPITLVFLGGAAFFGWKLDASRHANVRRQLDERDALEAAQSGAMERIAGVSLPTPDRPARAAE